VTGRGCSVAATGATTAAMTATTGKTTGATGATTGKTTGATGATTGKTVVVSGRDCSGNRELDDQAARVLLTSLCPLLDLGVFSAEHRAASAGCHDPAVTWGERDLHAGIGTG
jgi:hypothetical protein